MTKEEFIEHMVTISAGLVASGHFSGRQTDWSEDANGSHQLTKAVFKRKSFFFVTEAAHALLADIYQKADSLEPME